MISPVTDVQTADRGTVPLGEIAALGPDVLWKAIERALPGVDPESVPVAAFQSSI